MYPICFIGGTVHVQTGACISRYRDTQIPVYHPGPQSRIHRTSWGIYCMFSCGEISYRQPCIQVRVVVEVQHGVTLGGTFSGLQLVRHILTRQGSLYLIADMIRLLDWKREPSNVDFGGNMPCLESLFDQLNGRLFISVDENRDADWLILCLSRNVRLVGYLGDWLC